MLKGSGKAELMLQPSGKIGPTPERSGEAEPASLASGKMNLMPGPPSEVGPFLRRPRLYFGHVLCRSGGFDSLLSPYIWVP
jgi:hypothetical protein